MTAEEKARGTSFHNETPVNPIDNYQYKVSNSLGDKQTAPPPIGAVPEHDDAAAETDKDSISFKPVEKPIGSAIDYVLNLVKHPTRPEELPNESGVLIRKPANQWIEEAASRQNPKPLWKSLWFEGEACCLYADSNVGKSLYAVEIANEISKSEKVLYFDFELSDKQFQLRYTDDNGNRYRFPDRLIRVEVNPMGITDGDFGDAVISDIERLLLEDNCKVLIIDNITYLNSNTEKAEEASKLMMKLIQLKRSYGISILVLAHTHKRSLTLPITENDLGGSKKLYNFFDSAFSIGRSTKDTGLRYIKQQKVRNCSKEYGEDNVIVAEIVKEGAFIHFKEIGFAHEREHLQEPTEKDDTGLRDQITELQAEGKTIREIADMLGLSKSKVGRMLKK